MPLNTGGPSAVRCPVSEDCEGHQRMCTCVLTVNGCRVRMRSSSRHCVIAWLDGRYLFIIFISSGVRSASLWLDYLSYFRKLSKPCPHSPLLGSSDRSSVSDGAEECVAWCRPSAAAILVSGFLSTSCRQCNQALPCGHMLTMLTC